MTDQPNGLQVLADRHGVSLDAVRHLVRALEAGNGTMAQFNHPELGGFGQWSSGGMTMIGSMFDTSLKQRVAALCTELAGSLPPPTRDGNDATAASWWPAELGRPATSGAQNAMRYAYFPGSRRLAIDNGGVLALYDTGEHDIGGVSQQQGGGQSLRFTGQAGAVDLESLRRIDDPMAEPAPRAEPRPFEPEPLRPLPATAEAPPRTAEPAPPGDVITILERLSELHRKGVVTDAEFAAKKAELLARL